MKSTVTEDTSSGHSRSASSQGTAIIPAAAPRPEAAPVVMMPVMPAGFLQGGQGGSTGQALHAAAGVPAEVMGMGMSHMQQSQQQQQQQQQQQRKRLRC